MNRQSAFAIACAVSATAALGVVASPAQAITLGDLVMETDNPLVYTSNGETIQVEDKLFSNFNFQVACLGVPCPESDSPDNPVAPVDPVSITVGPATTPHGPGLKFNDFWKADPGFGIDIALSFDVEVVDSTDLIHDIHLQIDPMSVGNGTVTVTETAFDMNGVPIGQVGATNESLESITDWDILTKNVTKLSIVKDIQLLGTNGETAMFTTMDQEFSQISVPEPGAVTGLLAIGSLSVGAMLKRHFGKKS